MSGMAATAVATLLQTALLARELGTSGLGIIASVIAVTAITSALASFRTTEALTRWFSEPFFKRSSRAMAALISSALLAEIIPRGIAFLVILMLAPTLADLFAEGQVNTVLFMLHSITILLTVPQTVWMSLMREERRFSLIAGLDAGTAYVRLGALITAAAMDNLTIMLAIVIIVASALVKSIVQGQQIYQSLQLRVCGKLGVKTVWYARRRLTPFWKLMGSGYLASLFIAPFKYGDVLLLGVFTSTSDVGLYKAAKTIVTLLQTACNTLATVLFQDMNDALRVGKQGQLRYLLKRLTMMWSFVLLTIAAISIPLAPTAAEYIFGSVFVAGVPIFYMLFAGSIPGLLSFWAIQLAIATDVYGKALRIFYLSQVVNYGFAIWATLEYGAMGMAAAVGLHWTLSFIVFIPYSLPRLKAEQVNTVAIK